MSLETLLQLHSLFFIVVLFAFLLLIFRGKRLAKYFEKRKVSGPKTTCEKPINKTTVLIP